MNTSSAAIVTALRQVGISPKVKLPAIALVAIGAVVAVIGLVAGDTPTLTAGLGLIAASGVSFGVGYQASPGTVVPASTPGMTVNVTPGPAGP